MLKANVALTLFASFFLLCCGTKNSIQGTIIDEQKSIDSLIKIIVTEYNGGATTSFTRRVYLQDVSTENIYEMLLVDKTKGLGVKWEGENIVSIDMPCGHVHKFINFYEALNDKHNYVKTIELRLKTKGLCLKEFGYEN
ncbi:MAG: hypothetical protein M0P19_14360 [Nevskia sp.]|jgi:hypothetical protein|nr:hypothetical protein [Nevskia sp.]